MHKTTYEMLETIQTNSIWIIVILIAILIFLIGIYTIICRLEKQEKQKKEDRRIMLEKIEYTNKLLENILTKQSQDFVNTELVNNIINKNMHVENKKKEENKVNVITNKFNQLKDWIRE